MTRGAWDFTTRWPLNELSSCHSQMAAASRCVIRFFSSVTPNPKLFLDFLPSIALSWLKSFSFHLDTKIIQEGICILVFEQEIKAYGSWRLVGINCDETVFAYCDLFLRVCPENMKHNDLKELFHVKTALKLSYHAEQGFPTGKQPHWSVNMFTTISHTRTKCSTTTCMCRGWLERFRMSSFASQKKFWQVEGNGCRVVENWTIIAHPDK